MSSALTVSRPSLSSLAVPGAMFSPTELQIGARTSQDEFVRIGKAITAIADADQLWACDFALHGMRRWGQDDGLALAASATGLSKFFLKRCARIAERFTPERRHPNLNRNHYRILLPFDQAQIDAWLPAVADRKRLSAKSLRALAVEKFGEPVTAKQPSKHSVLIRETLWTRLTQHAPSRKAVVLVELILEEWLKQPAETQVIVLAAEQLWKEQKKDRAARRSRSRKAGSGPKESDAPGTADVRYQLKLYEDAQRAAREAQKDAVGTSRNGVPPANNTSPSSQTSAPPWSAEDERPGARAGYEDRRKQQIAEGAEPVKKKCKIEIAWVPCKGRSVAYKRMRADLFPDPDAATSAAAEYRACRGWTPFISYCELCGAFHLYRDPQ